MITENTLADLLPTPNLDGLSVEELTALQPVLECLADYARQKRRAMLRRAEGQIAEALIAERRCDRLYADLPQWARW